MEILTGKFNEGIPNAGPTTILVGHPFHLVSRRCRSEHEALGKAASTQPTGVVELRCIRDTVDEMMELSF
jgi:hypothetical protein